MRKSAVKEKEELDNTIKILSNGMVLKLTGLLDMMACIIDL